MCSVVLVYKVEKVAPQHIEYTGYVLKPRLSCKLKPTDLLNQDKLSMLNKGIAS